MPAERTFAQARGRRGGLTRAALAEDRRGITQAARDKRWEGYRQRVIDVVGLNPDDPGDNAEIDRRALLLQRADMVGMSLLAAKARRLKAEAAAIEAEIAGAESTA